MAPIYNTAAIRDLLNTTFSDEEISVLSFDYFPSVYADFSTGMTKGQKVQQLIDYCVRRGLIPQLLATIQKERPAQYGHYRSALATGEDNESMPAARSEDLDSLRRQIAEARLNLKLIEERKAQYVLEIDVPLQLLKEERRLRSQIAEWERRLEDLSSNVH